MRIVTTILLLAAAPLLPLKAQSQQEQAAKAAATQVQMQLADERVRLVHSQPWYAAGERLWFSAFVNHNSTHPPSRTLYVELLDPKGNAVVNQRLVVEKGMAQGDFLLPADLPSGNYTLQAATSWMHNFSKGQRYQEQLLVVNSAEVKALQGEMLKPAPLQVRFFPESGSLLQGITTKMTVTVTNAAGIGEAAEGTLADTAGRTVATFKTDATGIAVFDLKAVSQEQLIARVYAKGLDTQQVSLPKPRQNGLALAVRQVSEAGIQAEVRNTSPWGYTLVAESGGKVYHVLSGTGSGAVEVPWQAGISAPVRLLLLNSGGLVEAEQLLRLPLQSSLEVSTDKKQYGTRQPVTVKLQGLTPTTRLSVTVAGQKPAIQSPMAPSQALQNVDEELWQAVAEGRTAASHKRETLVEPMRQEGVKSPFQRSALDKRIDTAFVQALPPQVVAFAQQHYKRTRINEIYGLTEPHAAAPLPRLPTDRVFKLDDYVIFNNVEEALREATTNLRVRNKKGRISVRLLYVAPGTKRMMKGEPLYLLDGVMLDNMDEIQALDLNDIASIEIAWSEEKLYAGNLGSMVDNGMLAIYTKSGESRERLKAKGLPLLYGQYNLPRNFVLPSAATGTAAEQHTPDFRQLLFWEPLLQAGPDGTATVTFYTSDETGNFQVRVQGQTREGAPVSGATEFKVELLE